LWEAQDGDHWSDALANAGPVAARTKHTLSISSACESHSKSNFAIILSCPMIERRRLMLLQISTVLERSRPQAQLLVRSREFRPHRFCAAGKWGLAFQSRITANEVQFNSKVLIQI
jgi:hypothetical protein